MRVLARLHARSKLPCQIRAALPRLALLTADRPDRGSSRRARICCRPPVLAASCGRRCGFHQFSRSSAPNDDALATYLLSLASKGNVRTTTLKVFPEAEFDKIIEKVA
jgi:hypothetical protein